MATSQITETDSNVQFSDYKADFDAAVYLKEYYDPIYLEQDNAMMVNIAKHLIDAFDQEVTGNPTGCALDFGCGPSVLGTICASRRFPNVVCSDLVPGCRDEILKWRNSEKDAFDWSPFIKFISDNEGTSLEDVKKRAHGAISHVISCDARSSMPLGEYPPLAPYDVILANLVLQTACPEPESYRNALKNICSHLKPNGILIMSDNLEEGPYTFGDPPRTYNVLHQNKAAIENHLKAAGMKVIKWRVFRGEALISDPDMTGTNDGRLELYTVTAIKNVE